MAAAGYARLPGNDIRGQLGERAVVVARIGPQREECLVGCDPQSFGEDALGLLDDDPGVEGDLELPGDESLLAGGAFLQEPDGGDVDQSAGCPRDCRVE